MIELRDSPFSFSCASCGKLTYSYLIDLGDNQVAMAHNAKINLCDACKEELARRILFRRGKANATEQQTRTGTCKLLY